MSRNWTRELGLLGASLVAAYSVARLATGVTTATLATALIGIVVVAALTRRPRVGLVVGVVAVAAGALWSGFYAVVGSGLPNAHALRDLHASLQSARGLLVSFNLPLAHTPGIVFLSVLVGGLIAVAARSIGTRWPALSLVPAVIVAVWSTILLPTPCAAWAGLVLGGCGLALFAGELSDGRRAVTAVACVSLAAAALTAGWTAVAGSNVVSPGGPEVPAVAPSALSLATNLIGVESRDANVVLFRAKSPVSTYWQVATLTNYMGNQWLPDPATTALMDGSIPTRSPVASSASHVFASGVTLSGYSGRLLPAPPMTVTASGDASPLVTPSGVVATVPLHAESSYTVSAVVPSPVSDTSPSTTPPGTDTALGPIPAVVRSLAVTITGGQPSSLGKAEALTDYFRSGEFHYKVNAAQPIGMDPLVAFLTKSRTGSCEQFASAFAVLARASGLPTRVAVGFTPGRPDNGVTVVRGSDAHAWPQVLIGDTWVSFEPTPQLPSGELSPPGVLGPSGLGQPNPTGQPTQPPVSIPVVTNPTPTPTIPPPAIPAAPVGHVGWMYGVLAIVLLVLAAIAAAVLARRRRSRMTPIDRLVATWRSIDRALTRRGVARPVWRTPMAHVRELSSQPGGDQAHAALEDMAVVASMLEQVTYGSVDLSSEEVERAVRAGGRARKAILAGILPPAVPPDPVVRSDQRSDEFTDS
jgi:transglutaminase-like putative cysteine protease